MKHDYSRADTIVAVATPPGRGGVGVVRMSGPSSLAIASRLFCSRNPRFQGFKPYRLHHGRLLDHSGRTADDVLAVYMPGPGSYTGEDVVEVHCHGGATAPAAVLDCLVRGGARLAGPGEFTLRAFLGGRMDLTRAEAVAELISCPTRTAHDLALAKLEGGLSAKVAELKSILEEVRVGLCLAVDFPEEDVECISPTDLGQAVRRALGVIDSLCASHERARPFREGMVVVLAGRVNVGKSSLLNRVLGRSRAIVSDIPGTTRDFLEESVDLSGLPVRLVDTAGLRQKPPAGTPAAVDPVEALGIQASLELVDRADLVLLVVDNSVPMTEEEVRFARERSARLLAVVNKADLAPAEPDPMATLAGLGVEAGLVSAATGQGLEALLDRVRERLTRGGEPQEGEIAPNARQRALLARASEELHALLDDLGRGVPYDLLSVRLDTACWDLGAITGEILPEDVLDKIFSSFCIGK